MALISLFTSTRALISQLDLDVSVNETHEAAATLTQSEVEDGSIISDNVALGPLRLTIEGVVSKTPLNSSALVGSALTAAGGALGAAAGGFGSLTGAAANVGIGSLGGLVSSALGIGEAGGTKSRSPSDVWEYLLELRNKRMPMEVITALKRYPDMVLTNVQTVRNSQTTGALRFTATLEQVKIVKAQTVDIGSLGASVPEAAPATKLGKQGAAAASAKTSDDASILYQLIH